MGMLLWGTSTSSERHPDVSALLLAMEGRSRSRKKAPEIIDGLWVKHGKRRARKRGILHQSRISKHKSRKKETGSPWRLPVQVN